MFLPNSKSVFHKQFPNFDKKFNAEDYENEIENLTKNLADTQIFSASAKPLDAEKEWDLLGLRAFKTPNVNQSVFNILSTSELINKTTVAADFADNSKALLVYNYRNTVANNDMRSVEEKQDVDIWLQTVPPKPINVLKGFPKGTATFWSRSCACTRESAFKVKRSEKT